MTSQTRKLSISGLLNTLSQVKSNEQTATLAAFIMAFILMAAYFVLRPVRDALASDWSDSEVSFLWNMQFVISLVIVSVYGFAIDKLKFKYIVPTVYSLFAGSFIAFYLLMPLFSSAVLIEKAFYVWVSAFSLFHISVFWSFMSDTFNQKQSTRLFPIIAAGASAGAIIGPSIPSLFGSVLDEGQLMLIAASALMLVVPITLYIYRLKHTRLLNTQHSFDATTSSLAQGWASGFKSLISNPKLLGIAAFILLYVFIGSFIYFEQKQLLAPFPRAERTQILASIDWFVNVLTFVMAFFVSGRLVKKAGLGVSLALVPLLLMAGLLILAFAPSVMVILVIQIVRRAGNYSLTRPAREMLFTQVTVDERFKAKPVIDVAVYRGGDAVSGMLFAGLTDGLGLGLFAVSLVGACIASLWAFFGFLLGRGYANPHLSKAENAELSPLAASRSNA